MLIYAFGDQAKIPVFYVLSREVEATVFLCHSVLRSSPLSFQVLLAGHGLTGILVQGFGLGEYF
jgi:hypothetical protein